LSRKEVVQQLQRFLREPLLHFVVIGGLFFLLYATLNDPGKNPADTILISPQRVSQIVSEFNGVWDRKPTDGELDKLIQEEVRAEVYYRDALALGLDKNDAVVRRRLRQKMEFLTDTGVYLQQPTEQELASYFATNIQAYQSQSRLSFEQLYFGESADEDTVVRALKLLQSDPAIDPYTLGQRTLLPAQLELSTAAVIDRTFGKGFYHQLAELAPGVWGGSVTSVYGIHLVRTLDGQPARTPSLDEVRDSVLADWRSAKAKEYRESEYLKRRSRYTVKIIQGDYAGGNTESQ
jgi:hypothetical protein